jgi:hypothetical protein
MSASIAWDQERPKEDDPDLGRTFSCTANASEVGIGFYSSRGAQRVFVPWWVIDALMAQRKASDVERTA